MILYIGKDKPSESNLMYIPYEWLKDEAVHLYIASNTWEKLIVDLTVEIPTGVLKYVVLRCKQKEVILPQGKLSPEGLSVLCELYPEKAGELRKANMLEKDLAPIIREV